MAKKKSDGCHLDPTSTAYNAGLQGVILILMSQEFHDSLLYTPTTTKFSLLPKSTIFVAEERFLCNIRSILKRPGRKICRVKNSMPLYKLQTEVMKY